MAQDSEPIMLVIKGGLVYRLRERARIRRSITTRKSVQNNEPDRIADLLEEAAAEIVYLEVRLDNAEHRREL